MSSSKAKAKKKRKLSLTCKKQQREKDDNEELSTTTDGCSNSDVDPQEIKKSENYSRTSSSVSKRIDKTSNGKAGSNGISPAKKKLPKKSPEKPAVNRTITDWIRNPERERSVRCPICDVKVLYSNINSHLDSGCHEIVNNEENNRLLSSKKNSNQEIIRNDKGVFNESLKLSSPRDTKSPATCTMERLSETLEISDEQDTCMVECDSTNHNNDNKNECNRLVKTGKDFLVNKDISPSKKSQTIEYSCDISQSQSNKTNTFSSTEISANTHKSMDTSNEASFEACDSHTEQQDPYYLSNFKLVLDTVLSNDEDKRLFDEADIQVIKTFQGFSSECQKLYIRLFQRKPGWFRCSKLDYPKIAKDLKPVLHHLHKAGFLEREKCLTGLKETLQLLSAGDLKDLGKSLHVIHNKTSQGQTKHAIIEALIKHGATQKTIFGNASAIVLEKAKKVLGSCVRVSSEPKFVFLRVLLLFTMNIIPEDEENKYNGQAQQLSTIFLANIGKLLYPEYKILRELTVFADRDYMIKFANAYQDKHEMSVAIEVNGDLELAYSYYPNAADNFKTVLDSLNSPEKPFSSNLPVHLRCFSPEWVYTKMCYLGVEVLQKMKRYEEAVMQLKLLLQQDVYCADCRGKWWDRLALNVHQHLKQPVQALEIANQGLQDTSVRFGRRLALVQRVKKIVASGSFKRLKATSEDVCHVDEALLNEPNPPETVTIQGKRSEQLAVFIAHEVTKNGEVKEDTMTFLAVEEYALSHYRQQGYDEGIHGETSTFSTLYGLFFWDVIFVEGIPDVFRTSFQSAPLDINYDTFYEKRKTLIDNRLEQIKNSSSEELVEVVDCIWTEHNGKICSGVNWERFSSLDQAKQFVKCIGGKILSGIFQHFAKDMRHWHSGMPDLVVWNSSNLQYRIVEVKGPGDRLSTKQQIWLSELVLLGATVEVCYVTAVGGKRFRAPTSP